MIPLILAVPLALMDFSEGDAGLSATGDTLQWRWGVPTSGPKGSDAVWSTNPDGPYLHDAVDHLVAELPNLSAAEHPVARIEHYHDILAGDVGTLEVHDGVGWVEAIPVYGYPDPAGFVGATDGWEEVFVELPAVSNPQLRFTLSTDATLAADGWYLRAIDVYDGDVTPPLITPLELPEDTQDLIGPYEARLWVEDDLEIASVRAEVLAAGETIAAAVTEGVPGVYTVQIPAQPPDTVIEWSVIVSDGENEARYPEAGSASFRVYLAAPTGLAVDAEDRLVATELDFRWVAPDSPEQVMGYQLYQEAEPLGPVHSEPVATQAVRADLAPSFQVAAVYAPATGDPSEPLDLDLEVPELVHIEPSAAYPGETIILELIGESLYLDEGSAALELGAGVMVEELAVRDAESLRATVAVSEDAEPGTRDLKLQSGWGSLAFAEAFAVLSGEAPSIVDVSPPALGQGQSAEVQITASEEFAGPVEVQTDPELLLADTPTVEGDVARMVLTATNGAGVGEHQLVIDDGLRVWTTRIEVVAFTPPTNRSCATAPGGPALCLLGLVALARRRSVQAVGT